MLTELEKGIDKQNVNFSHETRKYKKEPVRLKNTISEMKDKLERMTSRLSEIEECTGDLEDKIKEITQLEQQKKEKQIFKMKIV